MCARRSPFTAQIDVIAVHMLEVFVAVSPGNQVQSVWYCVEPFIAGEYKKYTNNVGGLVSDPQRHTPAAFSHFTYEATKHEYVSRWSCTQDCA